MDENRFFGPEFGENATVPAPVGQDCLWCKEPIQEWESGVLLPVVESMESQAHWGAYHRECYLRSIIGSVAHQRRRCSCYGGAGEDDPDLTPRQAAQVAAEEFERTRPGGGGLLPMQIDYINSTAGRCPLCMKGELIQGPEGGAFINCRCAGCRAEFNLARLEGQIFMGDRLEGGEDREWCYAGQPKLAEWFGET